MLANSNTGILNDDIHAFELCGRSVAKVFDTLEAAKINLPDVQHATPFC